MAYKVIAHLGKGRGTRVVGTRKTRKGAEALRDKETEFGFDTRAPRMTIVFVPSGKGSMGSRKRM